MGRIVSELISRGQRQCEVTAVSNGTDPVFPDDQFRNHEVVPGDGGFRNACKGAAAAGGSEVVTVGADGGDAFVYGDDGFTVYQGDKGDDKGRDVTRGAYALANLAS